MLTLIYVREIGYKYRREVLNMENTIDMVTIIGKLKEELENGEVERTQAFLDLVLSNGDVLTELEEQLEDEL